MKEGIHSCLHDTWGTAVKSRGGHRRRGHHWSRVLRSWCQGSGSWGKDQYMRVEPLDGSRPSQGVPGGHGRHSHGVHAGLSSLQSVENQCLLLAGTPASGTAWVYSSLMDSDRANIHIGLFFSPGHLPESPSRIQGPRASISEVDLWHQERVLAASLKLSYSPCAGASRYPHPLALSSPHLYQEQERSTRTMVPGHTMDRAELLRPHSVYLEPLVFVP